MILITSTNFLITLRPTFQILGPLIGIIAIDVKALIMLDMIAFAKSILFNLNLILAIMFVMVGNLRLRNESNRNKKIFGRWCLFRI